MNGCSYFFTTSCANAGLMRLELALVTAIAVVVQPASAGETPWQEVAPGVQLRLISTGQVKADGTTMIGLEIDMPANTKTYWRVPGDTGLPTELNFAGSTGVDQHEIAWPYPHRLIEGDYLDYVYTGPTVLPVRLEVSGEAPTVEVAATLGVCSDICIPAQASFSLPMIDSKPDRANGLRLRQAVALAPILWEGSSDPIGDVRYHQEADVLSIEIIDQAIDTNSLIAATESGEPLFGAPQKSPEPNLVLLPVRASENAQTVVGKPVELTFMTSEGAYVIERNVLGADAE